MFVKFDIREETKKLAEGKRLKKGVTPQLLAMYALGTEEPQRKPKKRDDVDFLERLYRLADERGL